MIRKSRTGDFYLIEGGSHTDAWAEMAGRLDHDQNSLPMIMPYIPIGGVAVDGGSYTGDWTIAMLEQVGPAGQVHAFEPNQEPFECLKLNCPEAQLYQVALGDRCYDGRVVPAADNNFGAASIVEDPEGMTLIITLDSLELSPQFIKYDLEGFELKALRGSAETICQWHPVLVCEVNAAALSAQGTNADELLAFIKNLGYSSIENLFPRQSMTGPQFDIICQF